MTIQQEIKPTAPQIYTAIAAVQGELAQSGISKDSENTFDRYKFRGIDAVYNALSPLLAKHGLCVLPRIIERDCQERVSKNGGPMFYVTVTAEFDFVASADGSKHTVRTYGEAMDRGDKATNKAMSAAYKYAAFMAFAIPTEGDNDADASSHEIAPREQRRDNGQRRETETINDGELATLQTLIDQAGVDVKAFCEAYKIKALKFLPPSRFGRACDRLKEKMAEKQAAETTRKHNELADIDTDGVPF